jgi:hypothetical protein
LPEKPRPLQEQLAPAPLQTGSLDEAGQFLHNRDATAAIYLKTLAA